MSRGLLLGPVRPVRHRRYRTLFRRYSLRSCMRTALASPRCGRVLRNLTARIAVLRCPPAPPPRNMPASARSGHASPGSRTRVDVDQIRRQGHLRRTPRTGRRAARGPAARGHAAGFRRRRRRVRFAGNRRVDVRRGAAEAGWPARGGSPARSAGGAHPEHGAARPDERLARADPVQPPDARPGARRWPAAAVHGPWHAGARIRAGPPAAAARACRAQVPIKRMLMRHRFDMAPAAAIQDVWAAG